MPLEGLPVSSRIYPSTEAPVAALILAHGAGAGHLHPFMTGYAGALAALGLDVVTFNFPYIEAKRRVPDKAPVLEQCYRDIIAGVRRDIPSASRALFIGGKSMGGRMATHVAAGDGELPLAGLVLLGYPLHPPGRPEQRRDAHLPRIGRPTLFVQGSHDTFGTPAELQSALAAMVPPPVLHVIEGGDHSFKVGRAAARQPDVDRAVQAAIADWIRRVIA